MKWLVKNGANINSQGKHAHTVLNAAVQGGNIDIIQWLISQGANINYNVHAQTPAPLHHAVINRHYHVKNDPHVNVVQFLLENGASP